MRPKLTDAQRCMLRCIAEYGEPGDGWAPIEASFFDHRAIPRYLELSTSKRVGDALIRKGLIVQTDDGGPALTNAGVTEFALGNAEWLPDGRVRA